MPMTRKLVNPILIVVLVVTLFAGVTPPIHADQDNNREGSFSIYLLKDSEWQLQGELSFTDYETLQIPLSNGTGQLKIRLVQKGHDAAYVDHVMLQKYGMDYLPTAATNIDDNTDVLAKILYPEYDVCNGWKRTLEIVWDNAPENATLIMRAMEEDLGEGHGAPLYYPWPYEHRTLSNLLVNDGGITVDGLLKEYTEPSFSVFWQPSSPHPAGYTYGWIHCDNDYLYAAVEVTPDNTTDEEDWGALYVMVDGKLKEFRISEDQTWGVRGFGYTSSVPYEHRIYEFKIPLSEINATVGSEIQYIFGAYGTAAAKLMSVYVNGTTGNNTEYDGSSPTVISGSIGPKKTIAAGIAAVSDNGTVNVAAGTYRERVHLSYTMNLVGAGALTTIIDGGGQGCVVRVSSMPTQRNTISGFTIQNGAAAFSNGGDFGGGIYISSSHIVTIEDCAIINNTKIASIDSETNWGVGAGICNDGGVLYMNRCTVSGNTALFNGGGIYTTRRSEGDSGLVELTNCTISGNSVTAPDGLGAGIYTDYHMELCNVTLAYNTATGTASMGGGIASMPGNNTAFFKNCIVAHNTAGTAGANNAYSSKDDIVSQGNNIDSENSCYFTDQTDQINTNPLLSPLQDNGGPTSTHAITASSPAFNRGTNDGAPGTDQRGTPRPQGTTYDIGAYELAQASVATATGTGTASFSTPNGWLSALTAANSTSCGTLSGYSFPQGFFSFTITGITPGSTAVITITLPSNVPTNTRYWKCINGSWVDATSLLGDNDGDNILTLTIRDGGLGDSSPTPDGIIVDPGGAGIPVPTPIPAPAPVEQAEGASTGEGRSTILRSADMKARYLRVTPQQAYVNQPVTIATNVINSGGELGTYNVALKINDRVEQTRTVSVGPGSAQQVKFTVYKSQPGTYNVSIGSEKNTFTILNGDKAASNPPVDGGMIVLLLFGALVLAAILALIVAFRRPA